jgi:hypothetical protein
MSEPEVVNTPNMTLMLDAARATMRADWVIILTGNYTPDGDADHIQLLHSHMDMERTLFTLAYVATHSRRETEFLVQWQARRPRKPRKRRPPDP